MSARFEIDMSPNIALSACPFCGGPKTQVGQGDLIWFECDVQSPCFGFNMQIFCMPHAYHDAARRFNQRPLQVRARMAALNEAAAVSKAFNGRHVNASYAISRRILELKKLSCPQGFVA